MTRTLDFRQWAVVGFKDDTGLGRQARDLRNVLPIGRHIVIPSERMAGHPINPTEDVLLAKTAPEEEVRAALAGLQGIFFFERAAWHPALLRCARELGVKSVGVPNWEWFRSEEPNWNYCDLLACVNGMGLRTIQKFGRMNSILLPWCLDIGSLPVRQVTGPARVFIHNAGIIDDDDRKGTRETIEAFRRVKRDDIRLIVRMQQEAPLPKLDSRMEIQVGNIADHADLYRTGDVAVQPSKMEGIGFSVLEAVGAGFPVITTDYPPMNEYVLQPELRVRTRWFNRRAFPTRWVKQAHLRLPSLGDLSRKIEWCASHDMDAFSSQNRAWVEATFSRDHLLAVWSEALEKHLFPSPV